MMCLAIREMGLRGSPSECGQEQDRLSSCLNLMACVITWARLDSIAVVVPESVHYHRDAIKAIPQKPKAPACDLLFRVCTAASIHLLGRSARKHRASRQPAARWSTGNSSSHRPAQLLLGVSSPSTHQDSHRSKPDLDSQKADLARFGRSIPCGEEPAAHTIRYSCKGTVR